MYQWLVCDKFTNVSMKTVEYNLQMYQWKLWNTIYKCINENCGIQFTNVSMKTVEYNLQMYQW
jgi:hypothetical protein